MSVERVSSVKVLEPGIAYDLLKEILIVMFNYVLSPTFGKLKKLLFK